MESVRGPGGGYHLARAANRITIADIVIAVDEPLDATRCGGKQDCHAQKQGQDRRCITHDLWVNLNLKLVEYLDSVNLQDLVDQQQLANPEKHRVIIHRSDRPRSSTHTPERRMS